MAVLSRVSPATAHDSRDQRATIAAPVVVQSALGGVRCESPPRPVRRSGARDHCRVGEQFTRDDVFVALERAVYRFDTRYHRLLPVVARDLRVLAIGRSQANAVMTAPVQIIRFVVDLHRLTHTSGSQEPGLADAEVQKSYYFVDTGLIAGNVYLFAASQGLACWLHNCDRVGLTRRLKLRADQRVLFAQSIGYPTRR